MRRITAFTEPEFMGGIFYKHDEERFMRDPELREAYEKGYKCGRKEAYREIMEDQYGERRDYRTMPPMYRDQDGRGRMNYRDEDEDYMERRRRDSRGRYM